MTRRAAVLLALTLCAAPLQAQRATRYGMGLGGGATRVHHTTVSGTTALSGVTIGGGGRVSFGIVGLEAAYAQGSLAPDTGTGAAQDFVEGRLMLSARPVRWLTVLLGPHAQAYITPAGTERWLVTEGRLRFESAIGGTAVRTRAELWLAAGGSVNVGTGSPSGRGGQVDVTVLVPRSPVWTRLSYNIGDLKQSGGSNVRTVETFGIIIGIGGP